jgi:hypothetical protein
MFAFLSNMVFVMVRFIGENQYWFWIASPLVLRLPWLWLASALLVRISARARNYLSFAIVVLCLLPAFMSPSNQLSKLLFPKNDTSASAGERRKQQFDGALIPVTEYVRSHTPAHTVVIHKIGSDLEQWFVSALSERTPLYEVMLPDTYSSASLNAMPGGADLRALRRSQRDSLFTDNKALLPQNFVEFVSTNADLAKFVVLARSHDIESLVSLYRDQIKVLYLDKHYGVAQVVN